MEPCIQHGGVSKGSSSSHDSLQLGGQRCEELSLPILQTTASHNAGDTTQPTATTSIGLPETEASPAVLAHHLASIESEDFEMWLNAISASPDNEYGLIEPESPEHPLFTAGNIQPMLSGNPIADGYYHTDAAIDDSLPASYMCLADNAPYAMNVNSLSAPEFHSTTPDLDDFGKSNGSERRYQLIRKLAPAAEAQFMTQQQRTTNNEHLLVPATQPRKRRQCFDPMKKEKVKQVRHLGACLRCKIYKEPCDENTPCARCLQKAENVRLFKQPCYRESLDNVVPFRLGCARMGQVRAVPPKFTWSSEEPTIKVVQFLCWGSPSEKSPTLTVECRRFVPATGDKIDLEWRTGDEVTIMKMPPYAIYDTEKAFKSTEAFLNNCQPGLKDIVSETNPDEVLTLTLTEATRYSGQHDNALLRSALRVREFAATRLHLHDNELAIRTPIINGQSFKWYRRSTCPPYINYHLDYMINQLVDRHRKTVLKGLKSLIFGGKKINRWYEAFLLIYLLLSTLEFAYQDQLGYTAERLGRKPYGDVDYVTRTYYAEWEYSAGILITHFRCILRGHIPFLQSPEEALKSHARTSLDGQSLEYLQQITFITKTRNKQTTATPVPEEDEYKFRGLGSWTSLLFSGN